MITITPFDINSNGYQPDFYLHGSLVKTDDKVCILDDVFKNRIYTHFYQGNPLPYSIIDIPEGVHLCRYGNILCALFTWKKTIHTYNGVIGQGDISYNFDTCIKQNGLIVDLKDKSAIQSALEKYLSKRIFI